MKRLMYFALISICTLLLSRIGLAEDFKFPVEDFALLFEFNGTEADLQLLEQLFQKNKVEFVDISKSLGNGVDCIRLDNENFETRRLYLCSPKVYNVVTSAYYTALTSGSTKPATPIEMQVKATAITPYFSCAAVTCNKAKSDDHPLTPCVLKIAGGLLRCWHAGKGAISGVPFNHFCDGN